MKHIRILTAIALIPLFGVLVVCEKEEISSLMNSDITHNKVTEWGKRSDYYSDDDQDMMDDLDDQFEIEDIDDQFDLEEFGDHFDVEDLDDSSDEDMYDSFGTEEGFYDPVSTEDDFYDPVSTEDEFLDPVSTEDGFLDPISTEGEFLDSISTEDEFLDSIGIEDDLYDDSLEPVPDLFTDFVTEKLPVFTEKKKIPQTTVTKTKPNQNTRTTIASRKTNFPPKPPASHVTECKTPGDVALTYSEGPTEATLRIAQQLNDSEAKASFFVNSTWLSDPKHEAIVHDLYRAGHFIGMTYRVKNDDPDSMTDEELTNDIIEGARKIQKVIGLSPKYVHPHSIVRNPRVEKIMSNLGFVTVGYNLDSEDYFQKKVTGPNSIQEAYKKAFAKHGANKGSFISVHYDVPQSSSLNAVGYIVNTIAEAGYSTTRIDGCLMDTKPYKKSAESTVYVHDPFSYNQPQHHRGQKHISFDSGIKKEEPKKKIINSNTNHPSNGNIISNTNNNSPIGAMLPDNMESTAVKNISSFLSLFIAGVLTTRFF